MQLLIRGDLYEASEMYAAVMRASKRGGLAFQSSVPHWAHELRFYLRDVERESVVALFPGVIPERHDSRTGFFRADESFKWPPTATDMSHSDYSLSAGRRRLADTDDIDADVLKERAARREAEAVDAEVSEVASSIADLMEAPAGSSDAAAPHVGSLDRRLSRK